MMRRAALLLLLLFLLAGLPAAAQVSYTITTTPTFVINSGRSEVLGSARIIASNSGPTIASTIEFLFLGVVCDNSIGTGISLATDTAGVFSGGVVTISSVINKAEGCAVSIGVPGGLTTAPGTSFIELQGVRGQVDLSPAGAPASGVSLVVSLAAVPSNSSLFTIANQGVVAVSSVGLEFVEVSPGPTAMPTIIYREGFNAAFVQHVATATTGVPANARPTFGGINNTQLNLVVPVLPGRIVWPATVPSQLAGAGGVGGGGSELQLISQDALGATATYEFATADQGLSDVSREVFEVEPTVCGRATFSVQAQLFPAGMAGRPRFNDPLIPTPAAQFAGEELCDPSPLVIVAGNHQIGVIGTALGQPLVVKVQDGNGDPVSGATVSFVASSGGGNVSVSAVTTDSGGLAQTQATLGPAPGIHRFIASVNAVGVEFVETAVASEVPALPVIALVPHVVSGNGFQTRITVLNLSEQASALQVNFLSQAGALVRGENRTLAPNGRVDIATGEESRTGPLTTQWAIVGSEEPVGVNVRFDLATSGPETLLTAESFSTSPPSQKLTIPLALSTTGGGLDGLAEQVALANFSSNSNTLDLRLMDASGESRAQDSLILPPFGQAAFDVAERPAFQTVLQGQSAFFGSLVVNASAPMAGLALGADAGQLFADTVRAPASCFLSPFSPPQVAIVPHVVVGGGWSTQITITNLCGVNSLQFEVFDQSGNPVESFLGPHTTLLPRSTAVFAPPEADRSGPLSVRWARITSNVAVGVQGLLDLKAGDSVAGAVGIVPTGASRSLVLPVDLQAVSEEQGQPVALGLALANASEETNDITLQLVDSLGDTVAEDISISLPPSGQTAVVLGALPGFSAFLGAHPGFSGTLRVRATQPTVALGTGNFGPFFAIPSIDVP